MSIKTSLKSVNSSDTTRIALSLQYDGSEFCGWQRQSQGVSVQGVLEKAISDLDPMRPIKIVAAGRTDSGVHAAGQVVHFDCCGFIPVDRWASALNGRLPETIRIRDAVLRPSTWHACHSAISRKYRYTILNSRRNNLFLAKWSWHKYKFRLDENLMNQAAKSLIGLHDFTAFQKHGSTRKDAFTTIQEIQVFRESDLLTLEIQASGFLYGMVRLLVGQLIAIGEHRLSLKTFERRWKEKLRHEVRESAPAQGLCLIRAGYREPIFSESLCFDSFPSFNLKNLDPPPFP